MNSLTATKSFPRPTCTHRVQRANQTVVTRRSFNGQNSALGSVPIHHAAATKTTIHSSSSPVLVDHYPHTHHRYLMPQCSIIIVFIESETWAHFCLCCCCAFNLMLWSSCFVFKLLVFKNGLSYIHTATIEFVFLYTTSDDADDGRLKMN